MSKLSDAQVVEMREVRAKSVADGLPMHGRGH
jgi:hypothetical protein